MIEFRRNPQIFRSRRAAGSNVRARNTVALLLLLTALITVAGCSSRFLYNRLDTFIVWKIDDLVDLRKDQKDELKRQIGEQLEYTRVYDMPRVAATLRRTSAEVGSNAVTPELLDLRYSEMLLFIDEFMLSVVPIAEWFFLSLDEEQVHEMFVDLEEMNQEMYEEYSGRTAEERRANRNESSLKLAAKFAGRLRPEQKELITNSLAEMEDASEQWIDYQRDWQRRFRVLIENPPASAQFREQLTQLFVYPRSFHTPEYRATVDANRQLLYQMLDEFLRGLSDNQRRRVIDKLDGYADTLEMLSEPG